MRAEHTLRGDSHDNFTTDNYGIVTTSAIEWAFVVEPPVTGEQRLDGRTVGTWPKERSSTPVSHCRRPMPMDELRTRLAEPNIRLAQLSEPEMTVVEAIGARLYTGPLFVKFNGCLLYTSPSPRDS